DKMVDNLVAEPSARARELVRSALDLHVHVGPDVMRRRIDDVTLAERCLAVGLAGFGLKSHYTSTAERAQVVRRAVPGIQAAGARAHAGAGGARRGGGPPPGGAAGGAPGKGGGPPAPRPPAGGAPAALGQDPARAARAGPRPAARGRRRRGRRAAAGAPGRA